MASDRLSAQVFRAQRKDRVIRAENGFELARLVMTFLRKLGVGARRQSA